MNKFTESDIVIVGAGASGLMAARELAKAGKKVIILEARKRISGRVFPLDEKAFGYAAQGGAEFVHGRAPITRKLIQEAGLTFVPEDGEVWNTRNDELEIMDHSFMDGQDLLKEKLEALTEDIAIGDFLAKNFPGDEYKDLRNQVNKTVEGYEAADPARMSTFVLRKDWLGTSDSLTGGRIKEGYGPLIGFLEKECKKYGAEIILGAQVKSINLRPGCVVAYTKSDEEYRVEKIIVTVPLPVLRDITFDKELSDKIAHADKIGFGSVIKILLKFKTRWWEQAFKKDASNLSFIICNEKFMTWWTQYPEINTTLTAWMGGPEAEKCKHMSDEALLDLALESLARMFKKDIFFFRDELVISKVMNWPADPFAKGAYSYTAFDTKNAYEILREPYGNAIFFAGEALFSTQPTATVEGALGSGLETADKVLKII